MNFDQFTVALLILRADAPKLSEKEENALQDAHMAHVAKLHDEGHLLAAGPILGTSDRELRGLSIFRGSPSDVKVPIKIPESSLENTPINSFLG